MGLVEILLAILIVLAIYLIVRQVLGILKISENIVSDDLLKIGAIILLILILIGKVNIL